MKISGGTKPYGIAFVEIRGWLEESGGETTLHVESGRIDHCHTMLLSDGCAIPKTNNACLALFDAEGQLETSWEFEGGRAKRVAAGPNGAGDEVQVRFDYVKSSARANDSTGRVAPGSAQKLGVSLIPASDGTPLFDQDGYFRPEYGPNPPRVQIRAADLSRLMGIEEAELEGAQGAAPDQRIFIQDDTYIRTLRRGPDQLKIFAPLKLKDARTLWFWGDATYRD